MSLVMIIALVVVVLLYFLYASLVMKKNKVKEAASGIDVQLKKRYDLIPNLLKAASQFMSHEIKIMEEITRLRTAAMENSFLTNPKQSVELENKLSAKLKEFNVSVENYPDLKSNQTLLQAMQALTDVEENIAAARRFYNAAVNDLNNAVEIFPSSVFAKILNISQAVYFEAPVEEKAPIDVGDYLK